MGKAQFQVGSQVCCSLGSSLFISIPCLNHFRVFQFIHSSNLSTPNENDHTYDFFFHLVLASNTKCTSFVASFLLLAFVIAVHYSLHLFLRCSCQSRKDIATSYSFLYPQVHTSSYHNSNTPNTCQVSPFYLSLLHFTPLDLCSPETSPKSLSLVNLNPLCLKHSFPNILHLYLLCTPSCSSICSHLISPLVSLSAIICFAVPGLPLCYCGYPSLACLMHSSKFLDVMNSSSSLPSQILYLFLCSALNKVWVCTVNSLLPCFLKPITQLLSVFAFKYFSFTPHHTH